MNIVMVGNRSFPCTYGGVEKVVEELALRLVNKGHKVSVISRSHCTPKLKTYKGVDIIRLPTVNQKHLEMAVHTFISAIYLLFKKCDVVHIHSVEPSLFSPIMKLKHRIVATSHGQAYRREKWGKIAKAICRLAEKVFVRFPDVCTGVSNDVSNFYHDKYGRRVKHIPNGIDLREKESSDYIEKFGLEKDKYVLWVGRLIPTKGAHLLIEAFRKINPELKLAIVGGSSHSDPYAESLKALADEKIVFTGYQYGNVLNSLYDHCRLFVFPSQIEGLPIVLLEALSALKPVIFSDIPENLEVAKGIGIKFKNGDANDLAEKLKYALDNPGDLEALQSKILEKLRMEYNWDSIVDKYVDVYNDVVKGKQRVAIRVDEGHQNRKELGFGRC